MNSTTAQNTTTSDATHRREPAHAGNTLDTLALWAATVALWLVITTAIGLTYTTHTPNPGVAYPPPVGEPITFYLFLGNVAVAVAGILALLAIVIAPHITSNNAR